MVTVAMRQTANAGYVPYIRVAGCEVAVPNGQDYTVARSLWEAIGGPMPSTRFARWRWRRGFKTLHQAIVKAIGEEDCLSA